MTADRNGRGDGGDFERTYKIPKREYLEGGSGLLTVSRDTECLTFYVFGDQRLVSSGIGDP